MRIFKRILLIVVALIVVAVTMVFMLENRQTVALTFMGWSAPDISVAVAIVLALLVGMLIGPVFAWIASLRRKRVHSARSI
ncbi:LapA family protein [Pseudomonas sp. v388]|uniref:LapA family protein n=1 Tax=Pseudomonas sp. v388 TaxID=2479849 RepID=UPI000F7BA9B2|nr:LapA family protein [Pseudomonas sp. v388]RRV06987.1 LapA family protein [Pseudomonas sp. v388]